MVKIWDANPGFEYIAERDLPDMHSWFLDGAHSTPPVTPLCAWLWARYCGHGMKVGCNELSIPGCKGWEIRTLEGGIYCSLHVVRDQKEITEREIKFKQVLHSWLDNFDIFWEKSKHELLEMYARLKDFDVDSASNLKLYYHNYDLMRAYMRMWEIHFLGMYASFSAWSLLESITKERFNMTDRDAEFQDMLRGYDNKIYQMDKKLTEFQRLAGEMGIAEVFRNNEPHSLIQKLYESAAGKKWYSEFIKFLKTDDIGGWRMRHFNDFTEPYWLEDPSIPLALIKDNFNKSVDFDLDAVRNKLVKKREAAIAAFLTRVPCEEKEYFKQLLSLAGKVSPYNEEHNLYCELTLQALMRRGYLAIGRRLAANSVIDIPEDIFMLNPEEIDRVIMIPETHDLRWITRRRRVEWEEWGKNPHRAFCLTDRANVDEAIKLDVIPSRDAVAIKAVFGEISNPLQEVKADLWGVCGSSGISEGPARVVVTYEDLGKVEPGDILVCPAANPAWTSVFGKIRGVITDNGGTLCHAAIIAREYGLPAIVNTRKGTSVIRSGQRIKMDAAKGAVFILQK